MKTSCFLLAVDSMWRRSCYFRFVDSMKKNRYFHFADLTMMSRFRFVDWNRYFRLAGSMMIDHFRFVDWKVQSLVGVKIHYFRFVDFAGSWMKSFVGSKKRNRYFRIADLKTRSSVDSRKRSCYFRIVDLR